MKKISIFLIALCAFSTFAAILAPNGRPYREIVISNDAPEFVKFAANELSEWLEKTADSKIPIVTKSSGIKPLILIGQSAETDKLGISTKTLGAEGFKIVSREDVLVIIGRDYDGNPIWLERHPWRLSETWNKTLKLCLFGEQGTLNGVYSFLQNKAGVRWYWPGTDGSVVQKVDILRIPIFEESDAPAFDYRYIYYSLNGISDADMLWMRRLGQGGVFPFYSMHNYWIFQKYKTSHPEYFALVDGERDFDKLCCIGGGGHLCLTNPDVVKAFATEIQQYFTKHPDHGCFPVFPMDGLVRVCGCPKCQAEVDNDLPADAKFSNHIWGFVNKVAKEVEKTNPGKLIACAAYEHYRVPPSRIPKLNPNVAVQLVYARDTLAVPAERKRIHAALEGWKSRTDNVYTWVHYLANNAAWKGLPTGYPKLFFDELKWLEDLKVWKGELIEAEGKDIYALNNPGMTHWKLYLTAKSQWNPDYDLEKVMDEYYHLFYGPAEKLMKRFWTTAFDAYEKAGNNTENLSLIPEDVYTPVVLEEMNSAIIEAEKSVTSDSIYSNRISVVNKEFQLGRKNLLQFIRKGKQELLVPSISSIDKMNELEYKRFVARNGVPYTPNTWCATARLENELILRFICFEPEMSSLKMSEKIRDGGGIWSDDFIEFFICPDPSNTDYAMQFVVNPAGTVWDMRYAIGIKSKEWDSNSVKTSVALEKNRWILDVRLSLDELGLNKKVKGYSIKANFFRGRGGKKIPDYSCWAPVFTPINFSPHRFGNLIWE